MHFFYVTSFSVCSAVTTPPAKGDLHVNLCYVSVARGTRPRRFRTCAALMSHLRFMEVDTAEHYGLSCKYICRELLK